MLAVDRYSLKYTVMVQKVNPSIAHYDQLAMPWHKRKYQGVLEQVYGVTELAWRGPF
jgi:hypothetical protein